MTNHSSGHYAEQMAAAFLKTKGYRVLELNWKNKLAEIDIVAERSGNEGVTFFEVKYRKNGRQGYGLDYITPAKFNQMQLAARLWVHANNYRGQYSLGAIELTGDTYDVTEFLAEL